jgi:outer membrane protein assembly factor BamB
MRQTFLLALGLSATVSLHGGDWPRWRGPLGNGVSTEQVEPWASGGPKKLWTAKVGTGFSAISVADGRAYTMGFGGGQDHVVCLDAATGKELWRHSYASQLKPNMYDGGPGATPAVADGRVFTLGKMGDACALDAATGAVVWQKNLADETDIGRPTWSFAGSPLVTGGLVLYNLAAHGVAVDAGTGSLRWKSPDAPTGYATPVPFERAGRTFAALFTGREIVAVEPATGTVAWRLPWRTSYSVNAADPVMLEDRMLVTSGYGKGAALFDIAATPLRAVWETKALRSQFTPPVVADGFAYGIDGDAPGRGPLVCMDLKDGSVKWKEPNVGTGGVIIAGDRLVVLTSRGELILAERSPEKFKPLARAQILGGTCWTVPTLANGRLYARNSLGQTVCVELAP